MSIQSEWYLSLPGNITFDYHVLTWLFDHPPSPTGSLNSTAEFLEEDVELLQAKGHKVERIEVLSLVEGTRRTNDLIIGVKDPRSADASAITMSNMP